MAPTPSVLWCLLGVLIPQQCLAQWLSASCPTVPRHRTLDGVQYLPEVRPDPRISFMDGFVHSFLGTVQPNRFPIELLRIALNDHSKLQNQETIRQVLRYEAGFLVCVAIGLLYVFLMPLAGLCLACCRCYGNCGGHMYQEQSPDIHRWRRGLYRATLFTTAIILAGNVCMFYSNHSVSVAVSRAPSGIRGAMSNVQTYLSALLQQINTVVNESLTTLDEMGANLTDLGPSLGTDIQQSLREHLSGALLFVHQMSQAVNVTSHSLARLSGTLQELQPKLRHLQASLQAVGSSINLTLHNANFTGLLPLISVPIPVSFATPNLTKLQSVVDNLLSMNMDAGFNAGEDFLRRIPQRVSNVTGPSVQSVKQQLENIKDQISHMSERLPTQDLWDVSMLLQATSHSIETATPVVQTAERYRWIICLVLCCVILLVVVCNALGLLLGPLGLQPKVDPTERSSMANCAGLFFMAGAGLCFLFGWILMLVVTIPFLIGGNVYAFLCVPIHNQELLQIIETPGLIPRVHLSQLQDLKISVSLSDIYSDCHQNRSLWNALRLQDVFDLDDIFNVTEYAEQIERQFFERNITLNNVSFLKPDLRKQLFGLSTVSEAVDPGAVSQQIDYLSTISLNKIADMLDQLRDISDSTVSMELLDEASRLREIQYSISEDIMPDVWDLNSTLHGLLATCAQVNSTMETGLVELENAQKFLDVNASVIANANCRRFLDCQMQYFTAFADWAKRTVTQEVGCCGPVAGAVDSLEVVACSYLVDSLNAFWFSLGWCLIFLIPSIIFSIKLAKFYRRMKYTDTFEDDMQLTQIPQAPYS
ncbi:prominin-2 [Brienomyrus brachyistius]|uniref:prominin-2 n=1 Tax=Brienomyrus brachyistius TaxID=42636 RepID=UPI0020B1BBED|nr:prominin-2 [Brienomyrus brachyistius]XP_048864776.1 prominin-2 [Brienomyrus brachyistius]XP_048864777.1 prominin-2 [Brienomyrus brachyistius]XP_048864778.1 prominin-2 [Brienomyrus brachyistius]